ncbi:MAG TPA: outer membrane protein transport protein [Burkholderiales bacterium]|nr:outer membrane protein transport protein [Burkholderiales bacterium]
MKKRKLLVSMMIAGGLVSPAAFATNGYFSHGYGAKSEGMGGVGIALPQDSLAAATNPAGMVMVGDRIDFGAELFIPNRSAQITGAGAPGANGSYDGNDKKYFLIPNFGYNKMMGPDYSLGVSIYGNGGTNTDYSNNPFTAYGGAGNGGVNLEQLFIAPTWSKKLNASNSIGVALNLAYERFSAQGIQGFAGASQTPSAVSNTGTDSSTGYGLHIGWIGQVSSDVTLGASYQTKTRMGKLSKYSGLFAEQGSFDIPATYGVGIAVKAMPTTTVAFDIQRIMYGDVPSIANPIANMTVLGNPLGSNAGAGFGWGNLTVYKLGISHQYDSTLTLRAGWTHNNVPYPSTETFFNILAPGVVRDNATLGATWKLADKSEITVFYMHAFKNTVNGTPNSIPVGYGGGIANNTLYEDSLGISYGW